jgi:hypothetical protein
MGFVMKKFISRPEDVGSFLYRQEVFSRCCIHFEDWTGVDAFIRITP